MRWTPLDIAAQREGFREQRDYARRLRLQAQQMRADAQRMRTDARRMRALSEAKTGLPHSFPGRGAAAASGEQVRRAVQRGPNGLA
ncbi:hypothetical protein GPA10_40955 [Streptomyces sp. p1417]|uniref:Uncharacterized protein n=1 Tax=Streptomyces typhae TaxID=2681492 RepID=A0A6L6XAP3_9ACTN|nr:hypothetical protein [Streptomyces typhae]MVO90944.1 hypothetical protein [Streptomyces typhae]